MAIFNEKELAYLREGSRLARVATVGTDGVPHVVPVGMWKVDAEAGSIEIRGYDMEKTKKYRDIRKTGRAALVIDDVASTDPWRPRGIEVRGLAEAVTGADPHIRIHPYRVISWGIESGAIGEYNARSVR